MHLCCYHASSGEGACYEILNVYVTHNAKHALYWKCLAKRWRSEVLHIRTKKKLGKKKVYKANTVPINKGVRILQNINFVCNLSTQLANALTLLVCLITILVQKEWDQRNRDETKNAVLVSCWDGKLVK